MTPPRARFCLTPGGFRYPRRSASLKQCRRCEPGKNYPLSSALSADSLLHPEMACNVDGSLLNVPYTSRCTVIVGSHPNQSVKSAPSEREMMTSRALPRRFLARLTRSRIGNQRMLICVCESTVKGRKGGGRGEGEAHPWTGKYSPIMPSGFFGRARKDRPGWYPRLTAKPAGDK